MDGMMVQTYSLWAGGADREYTGSGTINLPSPTAVIAELSVSSFSYLQCYEDGRRRLLYCVHDRRL